MAVTNTQIPAIKDAVIITQALGELYMRLKSANQRLNGAELLKDTPLADIVEALPYLSGITQQEWDGVCYMIGVVFGGVDGQFAAVAKIRQLPPL
jgi:hypothetical protein